MVALGEVKAQTFVQRITRLLERIDYRRADSLEDREAIFRLRYSAYVREGAIQPNLTRKFSDPYDDSPNAWIFGVYLDGELRSSFRMHVSVPGHPHIPACDVFPDYLSEELAAGKVCIDPTRFVVDAVAARQYPQLPYLTVRLGYMAAEYFAADYVLATVRAEHQAFYRRVFGHQLVCREREYPTLTKPISLMMLHYPPERERILERYPFFHSSLFERRMLFERPKLAARQSAA